MAIIGIILLVGIAVNDSIILVDAINQFRKEGMKLKEAIISAGQRRIRPIVMTTLTTILALLPSYPGIRGKCLPAVPHGLGSDRGTGHLYHAYTGGDPLHLYVFWTTGQEA